MLRVDNHDLAIIFLELFKPSFDWSFVNDSQQFKQINLKAFQITGNITKVSVLRFGLLLNFQEKIYLKIHKNKRIKSQNFI